MDKEFQKGGMDRSLLLAIHELTMLKDLFGEVDVSHSVGMQASVGGYSEHKAYSLLQRIHAAIGMQRGHRRFVNSPNLPPCDFFVTSRQQIVEFDEPQHFTALRAISLKLYPSRLMLGYDRKAWIRRCVEFDRHDNSPIYRDEQRAWYDTLRDFAPAILGYPPIIRIYAGDATWCEMSTSKRSDRKRFRQLLGI